MTSFHCLLASNAYMFDIYFSLLWFILIFSLSSFLRSLVTICLSIVLVYFSCLEFAELLLSKSVDIFISIIFNKFKYFSHLYSIFILLCVFFEIFIYLYILAWIISIGLSSGLFIPSFAVFSMSISTSSIIPPKICSFSVLNVSLVLFYYFYVYYWDFLFAY